MGTRVRMLTRLTALAVLLLGIVVMHHGAHSGPGRMHADQVTGSAAAVGYAESDASTVSLASARDQVGVGYQSPTGHFDALGPAGSVLRDHEVGHDVLSVCLAVLILLFGRRPCPNPTAHPVTIQQTGWARTTDEGRALLRRWGISLLLSLCVMRT